MCHFCFEARLEYHPTAHQPHRTEQTVGCHPRTHPLHNLPKGPTEVLDKPLPHSNKIRTPTTAGARKAKTICQYMTKTASAKPLLCPVTHLDDLGQRSKHALVGHELCLGTLQLHGNGGRSGAALGRARSND